jgi:hypothetical protein
MERLKIRIKLYRVACKMMLDVSKSPCPSLENKGYVVKP